MNISEANNLSKTLTDLNIKFWNAGSSDEKEHLRNQFSSLYANILQNGFKITRSKRFDPSYNRRIPLFKIKIDSSKKFISYCKPKFSRDCTTRCISACTGIDYDTVRSEQLERADDYGMNWRMPQVWSKSLTTRDFDIIHMPKKITRKTFIKLFGDDIESGIIATHSSKHIAAIDMAKRKIIDTFDSSNGRIDYIYVHKSQYDKVNRLIHSKL